MFEGSPRLSSRWWTRVGLVAALVVVVAGIGLRLWDPVPIEALRLKTFDLYNRLLPRPQLENSPVVVVDIDEKSLAAIGQWPWPRTLLADLLMSLRDQGAVVAGFDVVFPEPDRTSPAMLAELIPDLPANLRQSLINLPSNDAVFAEAMRHFRTVLGQAGAKTAPVEDVGAAALETAVKGIRTIGDDATANTADHLFRQPSLIGNIPILEESALGRGIFSVEDEVDGIIRRVPVVTEVEGVIKPSLTLEMLRVAFDGNSILLTVDQAGLVDVRLQTSQGSYQVPVDEKGRVWVYFSEPDQFNSPDNQSHFYLSAVDVLRKSLPEGRLAGKLVLIGTSAAGLLDIRATPIFPRLPGVEVHANLLETILTQDFIRYPPEMLPLELAAILISGLIMILVIPRVGPVWTLLGLLVAGSAMTSASWYLFADHKILIDITYPGVIVLTLFAILTFSNYARDAMEKRQVRNAFSQYLSPDLVEHLAEHPEQLTLGGETRRMTLLFSDIRGFTAISEGYKDDPQGLTRLINQVLTPLTAAILDHGGTIDKYMGDCVMAFWNAPLPDPDQERHACRAALTMMATLERINETRTSPLRIGIGINSGDCVVGNMGSDQRFDYSVLGDAVNLASRLEGQSKSYAFDIILGEETARQVADEFTLLELDLIAVKGKAEAARIFALLGTTESVDKEDFQHLTVDHQIFISAYRAQDWDAAERQLGLCRCRMDGRLLGYYEMMAGRIAEFRTSPPGKKWDGVYRAESK